MEMVPGLTRKSDCPVKVLSLICSHFVVVVVFCSWLGYNFSPQQEEHLVEVVVVVGKLWFCE